MTDGNGAAATEAATRMADAAQRTSREAVNDLASLSANTLDRLVTVAERGAWKLLLALGAMMWLIPLSMEVRIYGDGLATLSDTKFITAFVAGGFVLALGAALRYLSLHEISHLQGSTNASVKAIAAEALDVIKDTTVRTGQTLDRG